jgi:hypothetical protein
MEEEEHLKFIVSRSHAGNVKQQVGIGPFIGKQQELPGPSRIFQRTEHEFVNFYNKVGLSEAGPQPVITESDLI